MSNHKRGWLRALPVIGMLVLVSGAAGCVFFGAGPSYDGPVAASDLSRDLNPNVSESALAELVTGNSTFAFELLREITEDGENLFFSPYSVSSALAMAYAGARSATETQMAAALRFTLVQSALHPGFNRLDLDLNGREEIEEPYEGEGFILNVVNAVWGQRGYRFLAAYLDTLAVSYGAGLRLLDFIGDPEGARLAINDWVSERTNERIQELLAEGTIDPDTRLVLTNAVYFNAPWLKAFDEDDTETGSFTRLSGETVAVPMMHQAETFGYTDWGAGAAVELPYNGEELSMVLLVPDSGEFEVFEASLDAAVYRGIVDALEMRRVELALPRFEFESEFSLVDPLIGLGMTDAFDATAADFSGIDGERNLSISDVIHQAFVSVDEAGTEAAAATAVIFPFTAYPGPPVTLTVDRPFLFVIRDRPTGTILFVGRVVDP